MVNGMCFRILILYGIIAIFAIIGREYITRSVVWFNNEETCKSGSDVVFDKNYSYNPFRSPCDWNKENLTSSDLQLRYNCTSITNCFSFEVDNESKNWLDLMLSNRRSTFSTGISNFISKLPSSNQYISKAILGSPKVFLLSQAQWETFISSSMTKLRGSFSFPLSRSLDMGASIGDITKQYEKLFQETWLTDISKITQLRQNLNGFSNTFVSLSINIDLLREKSIPDQFDVLFLLNVLDQLHNPVKYLNDIIDILRLQNNPPLLIVSVPLPWNSNKTKFNVNGNDWNESVHHFQVFFNSLGLQIIQISRAPYLCQGTYLIPLFSLDAAIFALSLNSF